MASASARPRVTVIGGGIFGVSSALQLARLGAIVTLVTEAGIASGASGRSLSWLNSSRQRSEAYHRLRMAGIDRHRTMAARHPGVPWLRFDGGLTWDADDATNDIAVAHAHEQRIGYDSRLLSAAAVGQMILGVDARAVTPQGAIYNPGEGWVDLPALIAVLMDEYRAHGGRFVDHAGPARALIEHGRVTGVASQKGERWETDAVLLAAGPAVPAILAEVGMHLPEMTPVSLLVTTKPLDHPLRVVLNTPRVAVRPTPNGRFVLDSGWSEKEVATRPDGTHEVRDSTVAGLLREAAAVLAGNPELTLESTGVGPKPIPGDGDPVFGPIAAIPGYHVAFSHSGATLGLIAGELLAREIVTGEPHPLLAPFRPERFG